jgi:hypothetical protein
LPRSGTWPERYRLPDPLDSWVDSPNKQAIIDSTIPPTNNQESAIVRTLAPAIVRGVNDSTGIAVAEVYALTSLVSVVAR